MSQSRSESLALLLLPAWRAACVTHHLPVFFPWNSTFDMLVVVKKYSRAVDGITGAKELKLRRYELSSKEWKIIDNLIDVLKVHSYDL